MALRLACGNAKSVSFLYRHSLVFLGNRGTCLKLWFEAQSKSQSGIIDREWQICMIFLGFSRVLSGFLVCFLGFLWFAQVYLSVQCSSTELQTIPKESWFCLRCSCWEVRVSQGPSYGVSVSRAGFLSKSKK